MERITESELAPEQLLAAMRDFIDTTSAAMATQLRYIQLTQHYTGFFSAEYLTRAEQAFQATVSSNVDALNNFSATAPSLQIVHEKLGKPAMLGQFVGYDWSNGGYDVGTYHPTMGSGIWTLGSSSDIQLRPPETASSGPY